MKTPAPSRDRRAPDGDCVGSVEARARLEQVDPARSNTHCNDFLDRGKENEA